MAAIIMAAAFFSKTPKPQKWETQTTEGKAHFNPKTNIWTICAGIKTIKMYNIHPKSDPLKIKALKMGEAVKGIIVRAKFKLV